MMWRGQSSQPVLGQTVLPVLPAPEPTTTGGGGAPGLFHSPHQPVLVQLDYQKELRHDFARSPFVAITVRIEFKRSSDGGGEPPGTLVQFCLKDVEHGTKWTGVTGTNIVYRRSSNLYINNTQMQIRSRIEIIFAGSRVLFLLFLSPSFFWPLYVHF